MNVKRKLIGYYLKNGRVLKAYLKYNNKTNKYGKTRYSGSNTELVKGTRVYIKKSTVSKQKSKFGDIPTKTVAEMAAEAKKAAKKMREINMRRAAKYKEDDKLDDELVKGRKAIKEAVQVAIARAKAIRMTKFGNKEPNSHYKRDSLLKEFDKLELGLGLRPTKLNFNNIQALEEELKPLVYKNRCLDCSISAEYKEKCILSMLRTLRIRINRMYRYNSNNFAKVFEDKLQDIKNLNNTKNINELLKQKKINGLINWFNEIIKSLKKSSNIYDKEYKNQNKDLWKKFQYHIHPASEMIKHIKICNNSSFNKENF